jgi:hypothetical protein
MLQTVGKINTIQNYTVVYASTSLSLNLLLTILIVFRLVYHRYRLQKTFGHSHGSDYTSIAAMLLESAALYALFTLLYLIPFARQSSLADVAFQALSQVQVHHL